MCSAQPVSSAKAIARPIASSSAISGRESMKSRAVGPVRARRQRVVLGVDGDEPAELGADRHALVERHVVGVLELVDAAVGHERLEADHAALGELLEPVGVARDEAAPEPEVDARSCARAAASLASKPAPSIVGGRRVQRHVEERREPARGERGAAGREPFPVRPAGLVEVHVRVQPAGEDVQPGRVDLVPRPGQLGLDRRDHAVGDADVSALARRPAVTTSPPRTTRSKLTRAPRRARVPRRSAWRPRSRARRRLARPTRPGGG